MIAKQPRPTPVPVSPPGDATFGWRFAGGRAGGALLAMALIAGLPVAAELLEAAGLPVRELLRYDRAWIAAGEPWRLLTGQLVHLGPAHLAGNLAGLALLWSLFARDRTATAWAAVAGGSAAAVAAGLWWGSPSVVWYVGLSGLLHGLWAAAAVSAWSRWRLEGSVTGLLLALKLALEQAWPGASLLGAADSGLPVVTIAHLYGALGGVASAAILRAAAGTGRRPVDGLE